MCRMLAKKHHQLINERQQLLAVDVLESEEAAQDASINHDGAVTDEQYGRGLLGAYIIEEVEDIQKAIKYFSLSSYMLKPSHLLTHGFENNMTAHEKLFKHMCNFESWEEWREERIVVISYIDVVTTKYQCRFLNPITLECIVGYIMTVLQDI